MGHLKNERIIKLSFTSKQKLEKKYFKNFTELFHPLGSSPLRDLANEDGEMQTILFALSFPSIKHCDYHLDFSLVLENLN